MVYCKLINLTNNKNDKYLMEIISNNNFINTLNSINENDKNINEDGYKYIETKTNQTNNFIFSIKLNNDSIPIINGIPFSFKYNNNKELFLIKEFEFPINIKVKQPDQNNKDKFDFFILSNELNNHRFSNFVPIKFLSDVNDDVGSFQLKLTSNNNQELPECIILNHSTEYLELPSEILNNQSLICEYHIQVKNFKTNVIVAGGNVSFKLCSSLTSNYYENKFQVLTIKSFPSNMDVSIVNEYNKNYIFIFNLKSILKVDQ